VQLQACAAELKNKKQTHGRTQRQQPPNSEMMAAPHQRTRTLVTGRLFSGRRRRAQTMMGQSPQSLVFRAWFALTAHQGDMSACLD